MNIWNDLTRSKNFRIPRSAYNGVAEVLGPLNVISLNAVFCNVRIL